MADVMESAPGLSFPRDTFAKLTPGPFLHAHLKQQPPVRPNGRQPYQVREPTLNTGSLTHSNGSAVVRVGDTAIVCAIRGEILLASDIPRPPDEDLNEDELIETLGLVVPNLELSTGCSPAHIPGNPPTSLAQSLSYRISSLIHDSRLINPASLRIKYTEPNVEDDDPDQEPTVTTKAYWCLYIDIMCLALDGNAFDVAWLALTAALRNTVLPGAWWDPDRESILCSPLASKGHSLELSGLPLVFSFVVFTTASTMKKRTEAESWVLADPDSFEEDVCNETLTVAISNTPDGTKRILRLEKCGGPHIGKDVAKKCILEAEHQWAAIESLLKDV